MGSANCLKKDRAAVAVPGARAVEISFGAFPTVNGGGVTAFNGFAKYWFNQLEPSFRVSGPSRFGRCPP